MAYLFENSYKADEMNSESMQPPTIQNQDVQTMILGPDNEPLWTVEDVASSLRLKQETIRIMARKGNLPAIKIGRVWRFKLVDIREWVSQSSNHQAREIP